jgi:hypothetical protein
VAVDLDDRVVDIEQRVPSLIPGLVGADGRTGPDAQESGEPSQCDQEPRGDRVELTDVTEGERPQERTQRRRARRPGEDPPHPAVPQHRHVIDRVRTGDHPTDSKATFNPAFAPLPVGTLRCSSASSLNPARSASASTGTRPPADTRFGSSNPTDV